MGDEARGRDPERVVALLADARVLPVVVLDEVRHAAGLARVLQDAGLPVAEITLRTPAAVHAIAEMSSQPGVLVGAGTVLTAAQVDEVVDAGAQFVVSPGLSAAVVQRAQERGVLVLPGAVTATEIQAALEAGLRVVKFFPAATSGGPAAIRALAQPFPDVQFVPTGGVDQGNAAEYLSLAAVLSVGGSWMVPREALRQGELAIVEERVRTAVQMVGVTS